MGVRQVIDSVHEDVLHESTESHREPVFGNADQKAKYFVVRLGSV